MAAEKCIYCAVQTERRDYIINPKAPHELPCCSEKCFSSAKAFVRWDEKWRPKLYLGLFVLVVINLFLIGLIPGTRWQYLPMLGIGALVAVFPLVFVRYERYQALGIRRTTAVVRALAAAVALFALVLTFTG